MQKILFLLFLLLSTGDAFAQSAAGSPVTLNVPEARRPDIANNNVGFSSTAGRSVRSSAINSSLKTLVLLIDGQSNMASIGPTAYTPSNPSVIDNFNIYNSAAYAPAAPTLGATYDPNLGPGSIAARIADLFIPTFDRVIYVPIAVGGTGIVHHAPNGVIYSRPCVAMRALANAGITPGMTGVTFAYVWGQGESDHGTAQATYQALFLQIVAKLKNCSGLSSQFNGRVFINVETILANVSDAAIQAAQAAVVDGVNIYAGGNIDSLTGGVNRQADGTHLTDAGLGSAATLIKNAMTASGAPF